MLNYNPKLKHPARRLHREMTDAERALWSKLRAKQIQGVQFYRQRPIGNYIVDFYAPRLKLVVEVDGSQHLEPEHVEQDQRRDEYLTGLGLTVLRFDNLQILQEIEAVVEVIFNAFVDIRGEIPLNPPLQRGNQSPSVDSKS